MATRAKKNTPGQEPPLRFRRWAKAIKDARAKKPAEKLEILIERYTTGPKLAQAVRLEQQRGTVNIVAELNRVGQHFFPSPIKTVRLEPGRIKTYEPNPQNLAGYRPDHLALRPVPERLARDLRVARAWRRREGAQDDLGEPGTIFAPDTRYVFSDTSFPWCTCGRVQTANGWGSGVMIGPRHLMTASHVINWGPNNTAGWVKFTPLLFDTSEPFGVAWATRIYWWEQVNPSDGVNSNEAAFDYVVCVLDRRLGDITGWMGSRGYSSDWNGGAY